jgi:putative addiction module component (TIGR02574 family)
MNLAQLESEVMSLPVEQRAGLARRLLLSLDETDEAEFDRLWGEEGARRVARYDAGEVEAVPGDLVAAKARALLK